MTREWYMKPDGQIPAYEWNFSDVNPPVHAWYVNDLPIKLLFWFGGVFFFRATFRTFKIERKLHGREDLPFLERVFQKLLLNFTWYLLSLSSFGYNADDWMTGGLIVKIRADTMFLRVAFWDLIISVHSIVQSLFRLAVRCVRLMELLGWRSIAWTCMFLSFCFRFWVSFLTFFFLERLSIALELAKHNPVYEDIASKFFEVSKHCVKKINRSSYFNIFP